MKKLLILCFIGVIAACGTTLNRQGKNVGHGSLEDSLYFLYAQPKDKWPAPFIDSGVVWSELGVVPESPLQQDLERLKDKIELGKTLFFDPRLSGSAKISCATCHLPELSWTDGLVKSVGHDGQLNKRNSPTILNTWFYKHLFWDGRSNSLADQAFSPINSETEMHSSMGGAITALNKIEGYKELFVKAFGSPEISPETITEAIAIFEKTLVSGKADFDRFLSDKTSALSPPAIRGLHLFRTKARCMNCHNGPLFTDNSFHHTGLTRNDTKQEDLGRYMVTHNAEDAGRFKTPSLRDVMRTRPWMHNGLLNDIDSIILMYNDGMRQVNRRSGELSDPLQPVVDPLIKKLFLTPGERADIVAFLQAITASPPEVRMPVLPGRKG